jgi:glycosyltransferase involved in cell wall biosynthesis
MCKKVLFITASLSKGGAETQLIKISRFLSNLDYKVLIVSLKPINEFNIDYEKEGIPAIFLKSWRLHPLDNWKMLYKSTKAFGPDVVIAFMFIGIIFARLLKKLLKFNLISTIRIGVLPGKWYMPFILTSALDDVIVYNSNASQISFESKRIVKRNGIVINNGIVIPKKEINVSIDFPKETFVWICVAHFRWNKDYDTLFKAIALLKGRNFRVDIVGEYNTQSNPSGIIKRLKIQEHVNILGFKQNAGHYIKQSDAFVLSSHSEGMPNALLEAMAHSKPVLVTNIDCNNEVLEGSGCGLLSEIENEHDLASKMLKMMKMTAQQRNDMGEKGRVYIEKNFAENDVMNTWLKVINQYALNHHVVPSPSV